MSTPVTDERLGRIVRRLFEEAQELTGASRAASLPCCAVHFDANGIGCHRFSMALHPKELESESVERLVAIKVETAKVVIEDARRRKEERRAVGDTFNERMAALRASRMVSEIPSHMPEDVE